MEDINFDDLNNVFPDESLEFQEELNTLKRKLNCDVCINTEKRQKQEFKCEICEKVYNVKSSLNRHILTHNTFVTCEYCDCKFRRKDYLQKHKKRKHQNGGNEKGTISKDLLSQKNSSLIDNDHRYAMREDQSAAGASSLIDNDHHYAMREDQSAAGASSLEAASTPSSLNSAINDAVQDFTLLPNNHEQYDLLTFFANADKQIQHILKLRLQKESIKWYLSIQVELMKDGQNGETVVFPYFVSWTYTSLNIETFDLENLSEAFLKMFESFEKYVRESSGWVLKY